MFAGGGTCGANVGVLKVDLKVHLYGSTSTYRKRAA